MRLFGLALTVALSAAAGHAAACSCLRAETAEGHLASGRAELVFKGRVIGTRGFRDGTAATTFRTTEVLKGQAGRTVVVRHRLDGASCGGTYAPGRTVLVLADREGPVDYGRGRRPQSGAYPLRTSLCSQPQFSEAEYRRAIQR